MDIRRKSSAIINKGGESADETVVGVPIATPLRFSVNRSRH